VFERGERNGISNGSGVNRIINEGKEEVRFGRYEN
jgi:hypothetical protein